tara:strand:+ start:4159 stop:4857 length:699 start_codon:yes stop_codon:yes gene_type:complete
MTIRAVSFDLDDTLWPLMPVILKAEKDTNKWLIENYPGVEKLLNSEEMIQIRNDLISKQKNLAYQLSKLRELMLIQLGIKSGYTKKEAEIMASKSFDIFYSGRNDVILYEGVKETLEELKEKYTLGVITNGNADIEKIGISHFFEFNISASQINIGKPDPRIFEEARLKAGLKAEEICHVGDHPINDVEGSYNVGMKPIWFNEKKEDWPLENKPEYKEVSHWSELPETILSF